MSKFSKVGVFSGLNNLKDVTLDPRYSAICAGPVSFNRTTRPSSRAGRR